MFHGGIQWALQTVVGPILLVAVLIWVMLHNRASRREKQRTEEATTRLYDEEEAADRARGDV